MKTARGSVVSTAAAAAVLSLNMSIGIAAFSTSPLLLPCSLTAFLRSCPTRVVTCCKSSVGGGRSEPPSGGGDGNSKKGGMDDFLGDGKDESENLKNARMERSENSLPISYNSLDFNSADGDAKDTKENKEVVESSESESKSEQAKGLDSAMPIKGGQLEVASPFRTQSQGLDLTKNPYLAVVSRLTPSDLISKFTSTADPRVQDAVRATILGLIGNLPKMAFDTTTVTTGERLASLMFQLQMTGYMFKNAEYRLNLSQSLGMSANGSGAGAGYILTGEVDEEDENEIDGFLSAGKVRGKIKVTYGNDRHMNSLNAETGDDFIEKSTLSQMSPNKMEVEVDAEAYLSELRTRVTNLRESLAKTRTQKQEAIRKDLLLYIRTLPEQQLKSLTNTMSSDVLMAMKGLVNVVMAGIGDGNIKKDTVTEQSGEAMAQLCMWQLVVGYNLRELEVREEMKAVLKETNVGNITSGIARKDDDQQSSIDLNSGGFQ